MQIVVATTNQHKLKETRALLGSIDVDVLSLSDLPQSFEDPEETGETFQDNAVLKARYYGDQTQLLTLAEDSGLEVSVLHGVPGVQSHRFVLGTDEDRCLEIIRLLQPHTDRSAQFTAVACLYNPITKQEFCFEGVVKGSIAHEPLGSTGFGYDPIFIPVGYDQTFAQLGESIKNSMSHRHQALEKVKAHVISTHA